MHRPLAADPPRLGTGEGRVADERDAERKAGRHRRRPRSDQRRGIEIREDGLALWHLIGKCRQPHRLANCCDHDDTDAAGNSAPSCRLDPDRSGTREQEDDADERRREIMQSDAGAAEHLACGLGLSKVGQPVLDSSHADGDQDHQHRVCDDEHDPSHRLSRRPPRRSRAAAIVRSRHP
ncbi:hypothetical protein D9M68_534980 [compost metagenome]